MSLGYNEGSYYIQIDLKDEILGNITNLEKNIDSKKVEFLQNSVHEVNAKTKEGITITDDSGNPKKQWLTRYYVCEELKISSITKRVCYMKFKERTIYW